MSDYAEHLTTTAKAQGELCWLLPEGKWKEAQEKAILLEQAARALIELCKRKAHAAELESIARNHSNAQVLSAAPLTDAVGTEECKATPMVYAHLNWRAGRH